MCNINLQPMACKGLKEPPMEHSATKAAPMGEYDIAIVGAGPIGLMTANLLGLAGLRVVLFERNSRLVGLPRAIAYDAETLRLFAQVGLFDEIGAGPRARSARPPCERARQDADGGAILAQPLWPFAAGHLLSA